MRDCSSSRQKQKLGMKYDLAKTFERDEMFAGNWNPLLESCGDKSSIYIVNERSLTVRLMCCCVDPTKDCGNKPQLIPNGGSGFSQLV